MAAATASATAMIIPTTTDASGTVNGIASAHAPSSNHHPHTMTTSDNSTLAFADATAMTPDEELEYVLMLSRATHDLMTAQAQDDLVTVTLHQDRLDQGQCPTCGQQLYKVSSSSLSGKSNADNKRSSSYDGSASSSGSNGKRPNLLRRCLSHASVNIHHRIHSNNQNNTNGRGGMTSGHVNKRMKSKVPLTIPGNVERGQCLRCSSTSVSTSTTTVAATANVDDASSSSHSNDCLTDNSNNSNSRNNNNRNTGPAGAIATTSSTAAGPAVEQQTTSTSRNTSNTTATTAVYTGPFNEYGQSHGKGRMAWTNGDVYTGEFFNGTRHGHGNLTFGGHNNSSSPGSGPTSCSSSGGEYVGEWACNKMHGNGTRRFANGDLYIGPYINGQRCGSSGRFYFTNGDLYVGGWYQDQMSGFGRYYYAGGQRFEGTFVAGKRHGLGKFQRLDGTLDFYYYHCDRRQGPYGVRWSVLRDKAWKCSEKGKIMRKLSIEEALTLVYQLDNRNDDSTSDNYNHNYNATNSSNSSNSNNKNILDVRTSGGGVGPSDGMYNNSSNNNSNRGCVATATANPATASSVVTMLVNGECTPTVMNRVTSDQGAELLSLRCG